MEINYIVASIAVILLCYMIKKNVIGIYDYWDKRGIRSIPGALPFLGHTLSIFWSQRTFGTFCEAVYRKNKDRSVVGFYKMREPHLMIRDPELIRTVLISEFSKFHVNPVSIDPNLDPLVSEDPFFNYGEKWKEQRNRLTYALMSSTRLRIICRSIAHVCEKFTNHLREGVAKSKSGIHEVEIKGLCNLFTGEVVANAGFGVEGDFFINGSGPDSFREIIEGFMKPTFFNNVHQSLVFFFPVLAKIFSSRFIPKKMDRFFRRVISRMIDCRIKDETLKGNDFLQLMLDTRKNGEGSINQESITGSATVFFVDGYETSAITMAFFAYQLAENPEVQEKVREEVGRVLDEHNGEMSYESLGKMTYMDRALNESMRRRPAVGFVMRKCNERCKLIGDDGIECIVEPDVGVIIPTEAIQRDPKYWNEPDVYDPERFNEDRKKDRPKMAFLPFGEGPRICPGMRFALLQIKGAIATILRDFSLEVSAKTKLPLEMTGAVLNTVKGGMWLKFKPL